MDVKRWGNPPLATLSIKAANAREWTRIGYEHSRLFALIRCSNRTHAYQLKKRRPHDLGPGGILNVFMAPLYALLLGLVRHALPITRLKHLPPQLFSGDIKTLIIYKFVRLKTPDTNTSMVPQTKTQQFFKML